jgi:hypothetical protein
LDQLLCGWSKIKNEELDIRTLDFFSLISPSSRPQEFGGQPSGNSVGAASASAGISPSNYYLSTFQLFNFSTFQLFNFSTRQLFNSPLYRLLSTDY